MGKTKFYKDGTTVDGITYAEPVFVMQQDDGLPVVFAALQDERGIFYPGDPLYIPIGKEDSHV